MTQYSVTVTYKPDAATPIEITDFFQSIRFTEAGSGEIRSATCTFDADNGQFMTDSTAPDWITATPYVRGNKVTQTGTIYLCLADHISGTFATDLAAGRWAIFPVFDEFDLVQISVTDEDGTTFTANYEVDKIRPVDTVQRGTVVDLELLGPEQHLMRFPFSRQSKRRDQAESAFVVSQDLIGIYNDEKGSLQPTISGHDSVSTNTLPVFTANHYPFSVSQQPVYDGLTYIHDRVGSSVAAGGGGDFWEFGFNRNPADENDLQFYSVISGSNDSGVTLDDSVDVNPGEEEGGIESTKATVHATWGADGFGSTPNDVADFRDGLLAWAAIPDYVSGATYPEDSIVRRRNTGPDSEGDELHFKANKNTSSTPPTTETSNTDWDSYNFSDFTVNEIGIGNTYSPWTRGLATDWGNCGANPDGTQSNDPPLTTSLYVWDSNQVVYDGTYFRTWVDCRAISPAAIPSQYLYLGVNPPRGFRVLVDTSLGVPTADFFGFDEEIMEWDNINNEWRLFRSTSDNEYVCVDDEAKVYVKTAGSWVDDSNNNEANDAYHPVYSITNTAGHTNKPKAGGGTFGDNSAVTYEFRYSQTDVTSRTARGYYRAGACINLKAPFSSNSYNGTSIGGLFGTSVVVREPATFDTNNMEYEPASNRGFNNAEAKNLGPWDGIKFMTKFDWRYSKAGTGNLVRAGNIPARCFMYDVFDNVVIADFTISHNNNWQEVHIPFSTFSDYRARIPWSIENLGSNVFLQELEILQRFDYTNIKKIGFQWLTPYDDQGRYSLIHNAFGTIFTSLEDIIAGLFNDGFNIKWSIDAFHFTKPLLAVSPPVTTGRAMFVEFDEEPLIINSYQLTQTNLAKLEQNKFRHQEYVVDTEGRFNIGLFDTFHMTNSRIINNNDGSGNTVELVAKQIEYTIDKPAGGIGGFMRKITGVKRLS